MKFRKILSVLVLSTLVLVACGKKEENKEVGKVENPVKIGVVGENNEVWDFVIEKLKAQDIYAELVTFTSYNEPNEALLAGDLDLNSFQHQKFLDNFNEQKNSQLTTIGHTVLAPLGLYSNQIKSLDDLKENDRIAIPDDVANYSRSLVLLQTAGLIDLADKEEPYQIEDIKNNKLNLEIIPLEAAQTARSLDDVKAAVINNGLATDAGYNPLKDSIFLEPVDEASKPYINIIACRGEEKENEIYKKIVEAYEADDTREKLNEIYKGSMLPAWDIQ